MCALDVEMIVTTFAEELARWQRRAGRKSLPWLRTRDPYQRLVAEVMLQQTQTGTVAPYWERFMARWPTVSDLAAAESDEVMKVWEGLGYYRRCRMLHEAARRIVTDFGGHTPGTYGELIQLPGIGDATAASLAAACSNERCAMIDGNVKRVLARVFRIEGAVGEKAFEAAVRCIAEEQLPGENDMAAYTQGLMDLGATVCRPREARCTECPVADVCRLHGEQPGLETTLPRPKLPVEKVRLRVALVLARGASGFVLSKAPVGVWHGLWIPPMVAYPAETSEASLETALVEQLGVSLDGAQRLKPFRHELTHRSLEIFGWFVKINVAEEKEVLAAGEGRQLFRPEALPAVPVPVRKLLKALTEGSSGLGSLFG